MEVKNTSNDDIVDRIVAYGLIFVAIIGIGGLILTAAIAKPMPTAGIAVISAAVGALAGILTPGILTSTTKDTAKESTFVAHVAVVVLAFVVIIGVLGLVFGLGDIINKVLISKDLISSDYHYQVPDAVIVLISAAIGVFGGVLTPICQKD